MSKVLAHKVSDFARFDVPWFNAPRNKSGDLVAEPGALAHVERLGCSVYGNPYYLLVFASGLRLRTKIDASINYGLDNFTHSRSLGKSLVIRVTKAGRVHDVREAL